MPAASPEALSNAFAAAINAGDVAGAMELWSEDPAIVQPDGQTLRGREAIEAALRALVAHGIQLEVHVARLFAAGDVATAVGSLTMSGVGHDGEPFRQRSSSAVIYARGQDGWRIAIDAPWGLPSA